MTMLQIVVLSLIQGLTEFLPVSSSAHLILGSRLFDWSDQGLVFDVATHLGTLFAVLFYFRLELRELCRAWYRPLQTDAQVRRRALGKYLLLASIPVIVVGWFASSWIEANLRDVKVIAVSTLVFGIALWAADAFCGRRRDLAGMRLAPAVAIGIAQVLALIPGASRSGVTMTMGRVMGFSADASARFSFLLSIPVIAAAGGYGLLRMLNEDIPLDWLVFGLAVVFSALAGWVCIAAFLALLKRFGLLPFVLYRLFLGVLLLVLAF
jgi:undecaprenyl-diphosphatase